MTEALRPSELFALRWRSVDDLNTLSITETVCRRTIWPFGKTTGSLSKVRLPDGLASELHRWKRECKDRSAEAFIFPNTDGGFIDTANYRFRVLKPLAEKLGIEKLNFQILHRTMATQAQRMGSVKDIQAHLRHPRQTRPPTNTCKNCRTASRKWSDRCTQCSRKGEILKRELCVCYQMLPRLPKNGS
jgi:integrase